jgi:hypothetical protein
VAKRNSTASACGGYRCVVFGRGEPLFRRLGVGVGGDTLTGTTAGAGSGGDSSSDSGGGEVKAGLGGSSSSSGGGYLKAGRAGSSGSAARAACTGTGAANFGGLGAGVGFTVGRGNVKRLRDLV